MERTPSKIKPIVRNTIPNTAISLASRVTFNSFRRTWLVTPVGEPKRRAHHAI